MGESLLLEMGASCDAHGVHLHLAAYCELCVLACVPKGCVTVQYVGNVSVYRGASTWELKRIRKTTDLRMQ